MIRSIALILILFAGPVLADEVSTRGVGVYPGDPAEDFSPSLVAAPEGRRNLALHRPATQSSAYDYNLAAQLVTDGIRETAVPRWFSFSTEEDDPAPKHEQAFVVDDNIVTGVEVGEPGWIAFELGGGDQRGREVLRRITGIDADAAGRGRVRARVCRQRAGE